MTTAELKNRIIDKINKTDDKDFLEGISLMIEIEEEADVFIVNKEQEAALEEAEKQIKDGKVYTNEEAKVIARKWQNK